MCWLIPFLIFFYRSTEICPKYRAQSTLEESFNVGYNGTITEGIPSLNKAVNH